MEILINQIALDWFNLISNSSVQLIYFTSLIYLLSWFFQYRSSAFLFGLWMLVIIKVVIPPSISFPIYSKVAMLTSITPYLDISPNLEPVSSGLQYHSYLFFGWIVIIMILLSIFVYNNLTLIYHLRTASTFDGRHLKDAMQINTNLIAGTKIYISNKIQSPLTIGIFKSKIYLPQDSLNWENSKLEAVLLHEIAHIKRHDIWFVLVQNLIQIIYFFHPLIWYANWKISNYREQICDDFVLINSQTRSKDYGRMLYSELERSIQSKNYTLSITHSFQNKKSFISRIKNITNFKEGVTMKLKFVERIILSSLIIFALLIACETENVVEDEAMENQEITTDKKSDITVGKIFGNVADKNTNTPISRATVFIEGTTFTVRTDDQGNFFIINVEPGTYTIKAIGDGFKTTVQSDVSVKVKESTKVDFKLESQ